MPSPCEPTLCSRNSGKSRDEFSVQVWPSASGGSTDALSGCQRREKRDPLSPSSSRAVVPQYWAERHACRQVRELIDLPSAPSRAWGTNEAARVYDPCRRLGIGHTTLGLGPIDRSQLSPWLARLFRRLLQGALQPGVRPATE